MNITRTSTETFGFTIEAGLDLGDLFDALDRASLGDQTLDGFKLVEVNEILGKNKIFELYFERTEKE